MGRPKQYADDAARQAAYRNRWAVKSFRMKPEVAQTIERLAAEFDASESDVAHALVTFALTNRNWFAQGLTARLPTHYAADLKAQQRRFAAEDLKDE